MMEFQRELRGILQLLLLLLLTSRITFLPLCVEATGSSSQPRDKDSRPGDDGPKLSLQTHPAEPLAELRNSLEVLQTSWFEVWVGTWPTAIDWTAAVLDTHLVASAETLSKALQQNIWSRGGGGATSKHVSGIGFDFDLENEVNRYFTHNSAYYFGEDFFSIRYQAYDDILWVVLGWLQSLKFILQHSDVHSQLHTQPWHGADFIPAYAHRARVFYELATRGWDTKLCDGGMVWNPHLPSPYKNTVTNQLFISASVDMYLHHPGDSNMSPYTTSSLNTTRPHNRAHLQAAIKAYDWLASINLLNKQGLYVDGYHISRWRTDGTKCNIRNEEVYTYNQAIILSGLRSLWESTGNQTYLSHGHELIRNTVRATNWDLESGSANESTSWAGLGRAGVLEDRCDAKGTCGQDPQSFKGIYFHHLTSFCWPLPLVRLIPGISFDASPELRFLHRQSCLRYKSWVEHNARAAMESRDDKGRMGMWWGRRRGEAAPDIAEAWDYRNDPELLRGELWTGDSGDNRIDDTFVLHGLQKEPDPWSTERSSKFQRPDQTVLGETKRSESGISEEPDDPNERGEGRTVETHGGGVAVLRAWWEFENML